MSLKRASGNVYFFERLGPVTSPGRWLQDLIWENSKVARTNANFASAYRQTKVSKTAPFRKKINGTSPLKRFIRSFFC